MGQFDYIIVGAGSAGCVLAERISNNASVQVLLLEAGPVDKSPLIHMPRGVGKLYDDPKHIWYFQTRAYDDVPSETWIRGKVLGGSSSINGMMYFRGQPQDYDHWEELGAKGWGWAEMARAFRELENHELGPNATRGDSGPLHITVESERNALSDAFIDAGNALGISRVDDLNDKPADGQAIGYATRNIWKGRRQSSAKAFLGLAKKRKNLTVLTGALVDKVLFDGEVATGVSVIVNGETQDFLTDGEVILSAGALMSPQILQRSGVGDAAHLEELGIVLVADSPGVGKHMLEHRLFIQTYEINVPHSHNFELGGWRLLKNVAKHYLFGTGALSVGYGTIGAFAKLLEESETADIEILFSPLVANIDSTGKFVLDKTHSIQLFGYPLRSKSEGEVKISSADPSAPASIYAGYLTDPYDQRVTIAMHRFIRKWMQQKPIADMVVEEREPSRSIKTDEQILDAFRVAGQAGYHACSTCRMGDFADAVVDEKCRVKGVRNLRVVDGSIFPTMISSNTNGPIMACAWNASKIILNDR